MLTLSAASQTLIATKLLSMAVLVEMQLTPALNLCTGNYNLSISGNTYLASGTLGKVSSITNTASEIKALQFELSAVPVSMVSLVRTTAVQGKAVAVKLALFNSSTFAVTDALPLWRGDLDTMRIQEGDSTAVVMVTAEHVGLDMSRATRAFYGDADHQAANPGDRFFQYMSDQFDQQIVWPSREFFKK